MLKYNHKINVQIMIDSCEGHLTAGNPESFDRSALADIANSQL